ncbi:MAG: MFS transporter [Oscillospiraceae bacterium]
MKMKKPLQEAGGIHRCKTWEMAFFALNNTSTNMYMAAMMFISYYATGFVGMGVVLVSNLAMAMRMFDGITDPIIGFILDKTNGKFGKNRPFIVIGNIILAVTSFSLYHFTHLLPESPGNIVRILFYIVIYALYIIGYTCQCVVTKSAQTCMTNDPAQRPMFSTFDAIFAAIFTMPAMMLVPAFIEPMYRFTDAAGKIQSGFKNIDFFYFIWAAFASISAIMAVLAIIGIRRKDKEEFYGLGEQNVPIRFRDYWQVLKGNRAIQMLVVAASTDKLFMGMQSNPIITVMLFGIICGNYAVSGIMGLITMVPTLILTILGMKFVASKMGQKKALLFGTYGCIIGTILMFFLFLFGTPTDLLRGFNFFTIAFIAIRCVVSGFAGISGNIVIPMTADCADYETYRSGRYVPGLMGTLFSFVDKMISSFGAAIVGTMIAAIGFTTVQPDPTTPLTTGIYWVTMICFFGMPLIGWLCNIIAMKFYPLNKEKMEEIQIHIADIKAKALAKAEGIPSDTNAE